MKLDLKDNKKKPNNDLYIYFSNFEEVGHGVSEIPKDVDEFVALDIGLVADDAHGDEKKVSIAARDNKSPLKEGFYYLIIFIVVVKK